MNLSFNNSLDKMQEFRQNFQHKLQMWKNKEKINNLVSRTLKKLHSISTISTVSSETEISIHHTNYKPDDSFYSEPHKTILEDSIEEEQCESDVKASENLTYSFENSIYMCTTSRSGKFEVCDNPDPQNNIYEEVTDLKDDWFIPNYRHSVDTIFSGHVTTLSEAISIQHTVIYQISKALEYCRKKCFGSREHVEAERILLLANSRKTLLNKSIIRRPSRDHLNEENTISIEITRLSFTINPYKSGDTRNFVLYFLCLVICNNEVLSTNFVTSENNAVVFETQLGFKNVPIENSIDIQIFAMQVNSNKIIPKLQRAYKRIVMRFRKNDSDNEVNKATFILRGNSIIPISNLLKLKKFRLKNKDESTFHPTFTLAVDTHRNQTEL